MSNFIVNPPIPYQGPIPGGLHDGKRIEVKGTIPLGADTFSVNFATGLDHRSDRPLHLSVRLNGRTAVRNSMQMGKWGSEERGGPFPFMQGADFTITITINPVCYFISVNGTHCWKFNHRLPMVRASTVLIEGRVIIKTIQFIDNNSNPYQPPPVVCPVAPVSTGYIVTPQPPVVCPPVSTGYVIPSYPNVSVPGCIIPPPEQPPAYPYMPAGLNLPPVINPTIPFSYIIPGGLRPGMMIYICGRPSSLFPKNWNINLQSSAQSFPAPDIAFHFGVRHHNRTVVRNSRINNVWEWEESGNITRFPFEAGVDFNLLLRIEHDKIMVALDNKHLFEFRHRLQPLSRFECLYIENDVHVSSLKID